MFHAISGGSGFGIAGRRAGLPASGVFPAAEVIKSVLPAYLMLATGAVLRRTNVLRREHDEGIMHVVFHVLYPCFILDKILGSNSLTSFSAVAWPIGLGFFLPVVGIAIGWIVARLIGLEKGSGQRTFALSSGLQNFGYTAIPVVQQLWPGAMAVLFVHNLGVETAVWSVGMMLMSGANTVPWKKLINGPIFAVVIGLLFVGLRWDKVFTVHPNPGAIEGFFTFPLRNAMSMLGAGAFPIAIMLAGAVMLDLAGSERISTRVVAGGALVRLVLSPLVILAAAKFLPIAVELKQVLVVQAAMPAAMTPVLFARLYGGRPGVAVQIVLSTTVLSLLSLPWIISWGSAWVGLKP